MADPSAALDQALERVVTAARAHLAAVRAAGGAAGDATVWRTYVALNHATYAYDQLLLEAYGEVTPWETELVDPAGAAGAPGLLPGPDRPVGELPPDPYPPVVSVRQRRDYRVPSVAALLAAGRAGTAGERVPAPGTVADAVLALVGGGDGSLASLDLPELEPVSGVVMVVEAPRPLPPEAADAALFAVGTGQRQVGRLDEQPYLAGSPETGASPEAGAEELQ